MTLSYSLIKSVIIILRSSIMILGPNGGRNHTFAISGLNFDLYPPASCLITFSVVFFSILRIYLTHDLLIDRPW